MAALLRASVPDAKGREIARHLFLDDRQGGEPAPSRLSTEVRELAAETDRIRQKALVQPLIARVEIRDRETAHPVFSYGVVHPDLQNANSRPIVEAGPVGVSKLRGRPLYG